VVIENAAIPGPMTLCGSKREAGWGKPEMPFHWKGCKYGKIRGKDEDSVCLFCRFMDDVVACDCLEAQKDCYEVHTKANAGF
jgi:hypothetical protein